MPDEGTIIAIVQLTVRDIYKANVSIARKRRSVKRWILFTLICIASATFLFHLFMERSDPDASWLAAVMLGTGVVLGVDLVFWPLTLALIHGFSYLGARNLLRSKPIAAGPFTYEFSPAGAFYSGPAGHGHMDWTTYLRVQETPEHFLLYVQKRLANVIPKKSFHSEADIPRFRELVRERFGDRADLRA